VIVTSVGNVQTEVPPEVYEAFQNKLLDSDLNKITSPLEEGKIEHAVISATDPDGKTIQSVSIDSSERQYFRSDEVTTTTSKPVDIQGEFVSLNKVYDRGSFKMQNGKNVPYRFKSDDPARLHAEFAYKGPVSVECVASFDGNLEVKSLEITRVTRLQTSLNFPDSA
jgi:hypothetical protein